MRTGIGSCFFSLSRLLTQRGFFEAAGHKQQSLVPQTSDSLLDNENKMVLSMQKSPS